MLEEIKEVLISEMKKKLDQRKQVYEEIKSLTKERDQKEQQATQKLSQLELDMQRLNRKSFHRIIHGKEMRKLCIDYANISNSAIEEIKRLNAKIESLFQKIYDLSHNEALIEKEIERIRQTTSYQELGLTKRDALKYIKNDEKKVVRAVFKNIKDKRRLETKMDIDKNLSELYQTNLSPFVVAMQKISLDDLIQELIDIGIRLEAEKVIFLKDLMKYVKAPSANQISVNHNQEGNDDLDNDFYNQINQDLTNMKRYASYPPIAISKIVTLAILVSIAKTNNQQTKI